MLRILLPVLLLTSCQFTQELRQDPRPHDERLGELMESLDEIRQGRGEDLGRREREIRASIDQLYYEDPHHVDTAWVLGVLAFEDRDYDRATWYLDSVLRRAPDHARAAEARVRLALEQGNLGFAGRLIEQAVQHSPADAGLREAQALSLSLAEDWRGARQALDDAERLGAPSWRVSFNRGLLAESQGNTADAIANYRDAIELREGDYQRAEDRLIGLGGER